MTRQEVLERLTPICLSVTSENDAWTITGEPRRKEQGIKTAVVLIAPNSRASWLQKKAGLLRKYLSDFDRQAMTGKLGDLDVLVAVMESDQQFGVMEALYGLPREEGEAIASALGLSQGKDSRWPPYGYSYSTGTIYLQDEKSSAIGAPLLVPSAIEFWDLLEPCPMRLPFLAQRRKEQAEWIRNAR